MPTWVMYAGMQPTIYIYVCVCPHVYFYTWTIIYMMLFTWYMYLLLCSTVDNMSDALIVILSQFCIYLCIYDESEVWYCCSVF
jgi:hypothetical protein